MAGRRARTLLEEVNDTLRERNRLLEAENSSVKKHLRTAENTMLIVESQMNSAVDTRQALYDAVRILAEQVDNKTAVGRRVRQEARKLLEGVKIRPPHALGSSRASPKRKKRKRKST